MAALASLSIRLSRSVSPYARSLVSHRFSTNGTLNHEQIHDDGAYKSETESNSEPNVRPLNFEKPLENGLDQGVYKVLYPLYAIYWASVLYVLRYIVFCSFDTSFLIIWQAILIGQAGQIPVLKRLKSGRIVTLFSVGTGGIRNNRRPLDDEDPKEYANRCNIQWHRVSVYGERLGKLAEKNVKPG